MRHAIAGLVCALVAGCGPNPERPVHPIDGGSVDAAGDPCDDPTALAPCGGSTSWTISCAQSAVTLHTLHEALYCLPGTTTPICHDDWRDESVVLVCDGACTIEGATVQFATEAEMQAFDRDSMCSDPPPQDAAPPGDGGGWPDAGPWPDAAIGLPDAALAP
jgi:hypothetical protein